MTKTGRHELHPETNFLLILQRHGLTLDVLEQWVAFLEAHKTGSVTFHSTEGHLQRYEERLVATIGKEK